MTNEEIEKRLATRMSELVGFLLIRASKARGEAMHYKAQNRTDLYHAFDGLCRGYIDSINEIGCRLSPRTEIYFDGKDYQVRLREDSVGADLHFLPEPAVCVLPKS